MLNVTKQGKFITNSLIAFNINSIQMLKKQILFFILICISVLSFGQKYTPTYMSKTNIISDLQFLKKKVERIHPRFMEEKFDIQWNLNFRIANENIKDSMTVADSFYLMSKFLSVLDDTHSKFNFPIEERKKYMFNNGFTMPFTIVIKNNKVYFDKYFGDPQPINLDGVEILSINNISSLQFLKDLRLIIGVNGRECGDSSVERFFSMGFWLLYGNANIYKIKTKIINSSITINGVSNDDYFKRRNYQVPLTGEKLFKLKFYNENQLAYLSIKSFIGCEKYHTFLSHSFDTIKYLNCRELIIDVRNNPGGKSRAVDSLMNYLRTKPYSIFSSIGIRVSDELKEKYRVQYPNKYHMICKLKNDSIYYQNDSLLQHYPKNKSSKFHGKLTVLINERTNSAAAAFAGIIKNTKIGQVHGNKPTGDYLKCYGDFLTFTLPNTKFSFTVSPKIFIMTGGDDFHKGIVPDSKINESLYTNHKK
jgi:C-terminal processing protease CtpA/Prc